MLNPRLFRLAAIGWAVIILTGCLTPGPNIPHALTLYDKLIHVAIFVPFGFLWVLTGYRPGWVLLAGLLYGGFIEILQGLLPIHRTADFWDAVADLVGTLVGVGLAWVFAKVVRL